MTTSPREYLIEAVQEEARADLAEVTADLRDLAALEEGLDDWFATPALSPAHHARCVEGKARQQKLVDDLRAKLGIVR